MPPISDFSELLFLALVALVAIAFLIGVARAGKPGETTQTALRWTGAGAVIVAVWLGASALLAESGILIRKFFNEPANTFVTYFPFVWLPAFLVQAAWFGHLLVFRRLRQP